MPRAGAVSRLYLAVLAFMAAAVLLLVVLPILRLAQTVWQESDGDLAGLLGAPELAEALGHTVLLAAVVTLVAVPVGAGLALALRRSDLPARRLWQVAVLLPVVVPDFVLAYSWSQAYGVAGFTDQLVGVGWASVLGPVGVMVVVAVNAVPVAYLVTAVGLATRAEPDAERAARASGAGPWTTLATVTLPLLRPALLASAALVFVLTLASFAIPQVLGAPAGFGTVTTRIYADLSRGSDPRLFVEAITLALLLVLLALVVLVPADVLLGPRLRVRRVATSAGSAAPVPSRGGRWWGVGLGVYLVLTVVLPLAALVSVAITKAVGVAPGPANWTLDNFRLVLTSRTFEALGRSLALSFTAATVLVVLGGCVAFLERRRPGRGVAALVTLALVLPGSTLAVALLISYGQWLADTTAIILLAYLAKLWAFAHRPVSGALDRLPAEEIHASRASGAGPLTAVRTVTLPPLAPALAAAWLVCFLTALHEVTMSSLLYGPGSETLAVVVLNSQELGRIGPTAALSVLVTVLVAVPAGLLWAALKAAARSARSTSRSADVREVAGVI